MTGRLLLVILFILLTDWLLFITIRRGVIRKELQRTLLIIHGSIAFAFYLLSLVFVLVTGAPGEDYLLYRYYHYWMDVMLILYFPKFILLLPVLPVLFLSFAPRLKSAIIKQLHAIHLFLMVTGVFSALMTFYILADGFLRGTTRFQVKEIELAFPGLPAAFDGFTMVHFSDIHLGSWSDPSFVQPAFETMQALSPDVFLFTGDLINVHPDETKAFEAHFRQLSALGGKYAVLGNHDLGDFARMNRAESMGKHTSALDSFYTRQGFKLLRNSHVFIHKGLDSIAIAGVDNWGRKKFKQYGQLDKALEGLGDSCFTILLSHDPSHWRAEVLPASGVSLTLSGHTHGGQLGVRIGSFLWSPLQYVYKEWYGLYRHQNRYLYVNPGIGYIGFSGRVGIKPELTRITLRLSN